jgi:hypothetical protein
MIDKDVHTKLVKINGLLLVLLMFFYSVTSYLIFLRDDFILERISVLSGNPEWLEEGRVIAKQLHVNSIPTFLFLLIIIGLFIIYFKQIKLLKRGVIVGYRKYLCLIFILMSMFSIISFPALSTDVFDYIASNRVLFVHHQNPWIVAPLNIADDDYMYLGSWKFRASVYGPVQFLVSSIVHFLGQDNLILNVFVYKLINFFFILFCIFILDQHLKRKAPDSHALRLTVFALNPLLHLEILGNAHNDIVMAFFSVSSIVAMLNHRFMISVLSLSMSVLAKVASLLYLVPITIWFLGQGKIIKLGRYLAGFIIITVLGFLFLGSGLQGFFKNITVQSELYLHSLPTIIRFSLVKLSFSLEEANLIEKLITVPLFLILANRIIKKQNENNLISNLILLMMIYLIVLSPMLQPWYLIWFLPLVSLQKIGKLFWTCLIFSFSSLLHYFVLLDSYYFSPLAFSWQILMYLIMVIPPILYWFFPQSWYTRMCRSQSL